MGEYMLRCATCDTRLTPAEAYEHECALAVALFVVEKTGD